MGNSQNPLKVNQKRFLYLLKETNFYVLALMPLWLILGPSAIDISLGILSFSFLYYTVKAQDYEFFSKKFFMLGALFWLYFTIQGFLIAPSAALKMTLPWMRFLLLMGAASWLIDSQKRLEKLFYITLPFILFALFDTALQYFKGTDIFNIPTFESASYQRLTGPLRKPRIASFLLLFIFPIFIFFLDKKQKNIASFYFILTMAIIAVSGERMPLLLLLFGTFILFLMKKNVRKFLSMLAIIAFCLSTFLIFTNPALKDRLSSYTLNTLIKKNNGYINHFAVAKKTFETKPVFGWGPNQFSKICKFPEHFIYQDMDLQCAAHPHNIYLQILSEGGLIGFSLFILFLGALTLYFYRHYHKHALGFIITAFLFLWPIGGMRNFFMAYGSTLIWFPLAITYAILQYKKYEETHQ